MEIILLENILNLGKIGEKVKVKNGYGRNFLLKKGKALRFNQKNLEDLTKRYSDLIKDINQNAVIKNIFQKKNEEKQIELLNEILKELNDIKFSKKIENLENKLIEKFDEKSYSDLIELKSKINKE